MSYHAMATSTGITEWPTPQWLVDDLAAEFAPGGFDLDPAATPANAKAPAYLTAEVDGLAQPWHGRVWCNPPYGRTSTPAWLAKAKREVDAGRASVAVCLVPARVETAWWRAYSVDPGVFVRVIGRIRWRVDARGEAPFPSAVIVFGATGRHGTMPAACANPRCPRPGRRFWPSRSDAKTCSPACRKAIQRSRLADSKRDRHRGAGLRERGNPV